MKRIFAVLTALLLLCALPSCGESGRGSASSRPAGEEDTSGSASSGSPASPSSAAAESADPAVPAGEETRVILRFEGGEAIAALNGSAAARDFLALLPASLTFEDYAGSEKISYLDSELSTADAPERFDPQAGDVTLYAPWGNLAIFYEDAGSSSGLVPMGRVISGLDLLSAMEGEFEVSVSAQE